MKNSKQEERVKSALGTRTRANPPIRTDWKRLAILIGAGAAISAAAGVAIVTLSSDNDSNQPQNFDLATGPSHFNGLVQSFLSGMANIAKGLPQMLPMVGVGATYVGRGRNAADLETIPDDEDYQMSENPEDSETIFDDDQNYQMDVDGVGHQVEIIEDDHHSTKMKIKTPKNTNTKATTDSIQDPDDEVTYIATVSDNGQIQVRVTRDIFGELESVGFTNLEGQDVGFVLDLGDGNSASLSFRPIGDGKEIILDVAWIPNSTAEIELDRSAGFMRLAELVNQAISQSPTFSTTPSGTLSISTSPLQSASLTSSFTSSLTSSLSTTATKSAEPSPSKSAEASLSESAKPSPSESAKPSPSESAKPSPSESAELSSSTSATATSSISVTTSPSGTRTVSVTLSPEQSEIFLESASISTTVSESATPSASATSSQSVTPSTSATISVSSSVSETGSVTRSATITFSPKESERILQSFSRSTSSSTSIEPDDSASNTFSASQSPSVSISADGSQTTSVSLSKSASKSVTASLSAAVAISSSRSPTKSALLQQGTEEAQSASVSPLIGLLGILGAIPIAIGVYCARKRNEQDNAENQTEAENPPQMRQNPTTVEMFGVSAIQPPLSPSANPLSARPFVIMPRQEQDSSRSSEGSSGR